MIFAILGALITIAAISFVLKLVRASLRAATRVVVRETDKVHREMGIYPARGERESIDSIRRRVLGSDYRPLGSEEPAQGA